MRRGAWFDLTAGGDPNDIRVNLGWLRALVLVHIASRNLISLPIRSNEPAWVYWVTVAFAVSCALALVPRWSRVLHRAALALAAVQLAGTLPHTANHTFVEAACLGLFTLLDENIEGERDLLVGALRWLTLIVFFYSGLQKILYGYYFDGQFLAYVTAEQPRFTQLFAHLLPSAELKRLSSMSATELGMGPYRVSSPLFLAISNAVYVFELAVPVLLVFRRTRTAAVIAAMAFVVGIELGAREVFFGTLTLSLLALFLPGRWLRRLFPAAAALYLYLLMNGVGLVPFVYYWV